MLESRERKRNLASRFSDGPLDLMIYPNRHRGAIGELKVDHDPGEIGVPGLHKYPSGTD